MIFDIIHIFGTFQEKLLTKSLQKGDDKEFDQVHVYMIFYKYKIKYHLFA